MAPIVQDPVPPEATRGHPLVLEWLRKFLSFWSGGKWRFQNRLGEESFSGNCSLDSCRGNQVGAAKHLSLRIMGGFKAKWGIVSSGLVLSLGEIK